MSEVKKEETKKAFKNAPFIEVYRSCAMINGAMLSHQNQMSVFKNVPRSEVSCMSLREIAELNIRKGHFVC